MYTVVDVTVVYFLEELSCGDMEEREPALNSRVNKLAKEIDAVQNDDVKTHSLWLVRPLTKFACFGYNPFTIKHADHYRFNSYLRLR